MLTIVSDDRCRDCGACCMFVGRPPFEGFAPDRVGQACTAFDLETRTCTIYADRPQACREFVVGSPGCERFRKRAGIAGAGAVT